MPTYEPGSPAFNLNEISLNIRRDLEWTERTAKRENLPLQELDVQFPVNPSYRQFTAWAEAIEQARDIICQREPIDPFQHQKS